MLQHYLPEKESGMKVLNFNKKGKVDVMECWNNFADECEAKDRREKFWRLLLTALAAAAIALGSYCVGLSHSQAETLAAREETQRAQTQATDANKLTATALQEMDRMENKYSLVADICPWFNETAAKVQKAELEIDRNEKVIRRNS